MSSEPVSRSLLLLAFAALLLTALPAGPVFADDKPAADTPTSRAGVGSSDWPNYRGPTYDLSAPDTGLLREWPKEGPKIVWKAKIGRGWCQPIVAGDEVFVWGNDPHQDAGPTARKDGPDDGKGWGIPNDNILQCLDAKTGHEKWRYNYQSKYKYHDVTYNTCGPHSTPAVSDGKVFIMDTDGAFTCVDRKAGTKVWSRDLWADFVEEYGFKRGMDGLRGWNQSPLVSGKVVIENLPMGNLFGLKPNEVHNANCLAMDVDTGKTVWRFKEPPCPPSERVNGGDAVLARFNGEECVVFAAKGLMRALRASDGKEMWSFENRHGSQYIGLLPVGNAFMQLAAGASYLVSVDDRNPASPAKEIWSSPDMAIDVFQVSGYVHSNGYIYGFDPRNPFGGSDTSQKAWKFFGECRLKCFDARTGKLVWSQPQPDLYGASCVIAADGLLFARGFNTLLLVEATPKGYVEKGRVHPLQTFTNDPPKDIGDTGRDNGFVPPALSRGYLYVRGPTELICFDVADHGIAPANAR